jgi:hypothetical protein
MLLIVLTCLVPGLDALAVLIGCLGCCHLLQPKIACLAWCLPTFMISITDQSSINIYLSNFYIGSVDIHAVVHGLGVGLLLMVRSAPCKGLLLMVRSAPCRLF